MQATIRKLLSYFFLSALAICLSLGITQNTYAHKGHAGPMINFMKTKTALKEMLPSDAKIVKRKQPLKGNAIQWAKKTHKVELDNKTYRYYLATDKQSGVILGAAYVSQFHYRHGDLKFAVGIDANQQITQAAILGINEKYVVDFENNVGTALIADYAGLSIPEVIAKTEKLASSDKATREFAAAIRDATVLLLTLIK